MDNAGSKREKFDRSELKQYRALMLSIFITSAAVIIFFFIIYRFTGLSRAIDTFITVMQPFVIGIVMAFLMNPIMMFLERRLLPRFLKKSKEPRKTKRRVRTLTTILSLLVLVGVVSLFIGMVVPRFISTLNELFDNMNEKIEGVLDWANDITRGNYEDTLMNAKNEENIENALSSAQDWVRKYLNLGEQDEIVETITRWGISVGRLVVNILLGMVISVYILLIKEQFKGQSKKLIFGAFETKTANAIVRFLRKTNEIFYGFIIGKIIDSIIIGFICYFCMLIMRMPYAVLSSVVIGFTNLIPVFGPYIGAVPTVIIIFVTNPVKGIYFLIFVVILQQIDGNIIGPKILGDSTGLPSFWVVAGVVLGGGLFGVPGMILGVPTMAVLYYLFGELSMYLLRRRGLPETTRTYIKAEEIDPDTLEIKEHS